MKIGFIGAGNMAGAIIGGILTTNALSASQIGVFDINQEKLDHYANKGLKAFSSPAELVSECKYIVLSVKPQNCTEVLESIAANINEDTVIITIAAGISAAFIKEKTNYYRIICFF